MGFIPTEKEVKTYSRPRLQNVFNKQVSEDINNISSELDSLGSGGGMVDSVNSKTGVVILDKTDIGLSNVDNTSDLNKPISTAVQSALNNKQSILPTPANANQYLKSDLTWSTFPTIPNSLDDLTNPPTADINMNIVTLYNLKQLHLSDLGTDPDLPTSSGAGGILYVKNGALMYANSNGVVEIANPQPLPN